MGIGTNIMIIMITINLLLFYSDPQAFGMTETIDYLGDIGVDVSYNSTTNTTIVNQTDTSGNETQDLIGTTGIGGIFSAITTLISDIVQTSVGFIIWILKFLYAPITLMNQVESTPFLVLFKLLFAVLYTVGYIIAVFQAWTGRDF